MMVSIFKEIIVTGPGFAPCSVFRLSAFNVPEEANPELIMLYM